MAGDNMAANFFKKRVTIVAIKILPLIHPLPMSFLIYYCITNSASRVSVVSTIRGQRQNNLARLNKFKSAESQLLTASALTGHLGGDRGLTPVQTDGFSGGLSKLTRHLPADFAGLARKLVRANNWIIIKLLGFVSHGR